MLSSKTSTEIKEFLQRGLNIYISAIFWDSAGRTRCEKWWYKTLYFLGLLYVAIECAGLSAILYNRFIDPEASLDIFIRITVRWFVRLASLILQYYSILYRKELEAYITQFMQLDGRLECEFILIFHIACITMFLVSSLFTATF